jgi:hypothetical protein
MARARAMHDVSFSTQPSARFKMKINHTDRGAVLSENAMFASVSVSRFSNNVADALSTNQILKRHKLKSGDARSSKLLFPTSMPAKGCGVDVLKSYEAYRRITKAESLIRKIHYKWTFEYGVGEGQSRGPRLLPVSASESYLREMHDAIEEFNDAVNSFASNYTRHVAAQAVRLNGLFDVEHYGEAEDFAQAHDAAVALQGLPSIEGINAGKFTDAYRDAEADRQSQAVQDVGKAIADRLAVALRSLSQKLGEIGNAKSRFSDSHFDNLIELVDEIVPACNIGKDERIDDLAREIKRLIGRAGNTASAMANTVKAGSVVRDQIKSNSAALADKATALFA